MLRILIYIVFQILLLTLFVVSLVPALGYLIGLVLIIPALVIGIASVLLTVSQKRMMTIPGDCVNMLCIILLTVPLLSTVSSIAGIIACFINILIALF